MSARELTDEEQAENDRFDANHRVRDVRIKLMDGPVQGATIIASRACTYVRVPERRELCSPGDVTPNDTLRVFVYRVELDFDEWRNETFRGFIAEQTNEVQS